MNSNTLNLDLAPEFWSNLDPIALNLGTDPQFLPHLVLEKSVPLIYPLFTCVNPDPYQYSEYGL